jgi:hypothetical protein
MIEARRKITRALALEAIGCGVVALALDWFLHKDWDQ